MSKMIVTEESVTVEEISPEQGRVLLDEAAQERFGISWRAFYAEYRRGVYVGTDHAQLAEELAFLAPFAG